MQAQVGKGGWEVAYVRYLAGQVVVAEPQPLQVGQAAKVRYAAGQLVAMEIKSFQPRK